MTAPVLSGGVTHTRPRDNATSSFPAQGSVASITIAAVAGISHVVTFAEASLVLAANGATFITATIGDGGTTVCGSQIAQSTAWQPADRVRLDGLNIVCGSGNNTTFAINGANANSLESVSITWYDIFS